jgi:hypothetical protein
VQQAIEMGWAPGSDSGVRREVRRACGMIRSKPSKWGGPAMGMGKPRCRAASPTVGVTCCEECRQPSVGA